MGVRRDKLLLQREELGIFKKEKEPWKELRQRGQDSC